MQGADPDHEKFIQVRADDRQKLQPFKKRIGRVLSLLKDPFVELKPAELPVYKKFGPAGVFFHTYLTYCNDPCETTL